MPSARGRRSAPTRVRRDQRTELDHPAANGFAADLDAALGEEFLDVSDTQGELEIESNRVADDLRREPVTRE
jgi:hypothetical protein